MGILKKDDNSLDVKIIENIRGLALDIINNAKSGHPGIALGAAPILYTLYANHLNIDVTNDKWINRDRFIMSAGHGSALLYATLYMAGFDISLDDLKKFRCLDSITPGHPEYGVTPGVDMSTGPLGQGVATSVGIAIGEAYLRNYFSRELIDYYTYVLCGDGDLMEGVSYEALALAGKLSLNKLIILYDSNDITLDGELGTSSNENIKLRFEAINWNVLTVTDGEDINEINSAIIEAKKSDKPTIIEIKTVIGKFSKNQGTSKVHGSPLLEEDLLNVKKKLNLRAIPFAISSEAMVSFQEAIKERVNELILQWGKDYEKLPDDKKSGIDNILNIKEKRVIKDIYYEMPDDNMEATRVSSGKIINSIAANYPFVMVGSADTASSTYVKINDEEFFSSSNPKGRNIPFGVREHAMGSIANGIALTGITPFVSTFLSFADYMKPAIRMSALMGLPVNYVFTHDSITVGEDGPTHQPVEQLVMLRSIPSFEVYRPADANEVLGSYKSLLERRKPSAVILGRNKVSLQSETNVNDVKKGAYILKEANGELQGILISSGEEIELALEIQKTLEEHGFGIRLVSMPSTSLFDNMSKKYQEEIIPGSTPTFVLELSSPYSWYKYATSEEHLFCINKFGKSASKEDILNEFNITIEIISEKIEELLK